MTIPRPGITHYIMAAVIVAVSGIAIWQTLQLADAKVEIAELKAAAETKRADGHEVYAKDSDKTAGKESQHAASTQAASDKFTSDQPSIESDLRARLAAADSLRKTAENRAARYRAQANGDAAACGRLADRTAALDASLAEGRQVAEDLRGTVIKRDREVVLLLDIIAADRVLLNNPPESVAGS